MIKRTLESEIQKATGVVFSSIPTDGKSRKFVVGRKEWFAISFGDCGAFGCFYGGAIYEWAGSKAELLSNIDIGQDEYKGPIDKERIIVQMGAASAASGESLSGEHADRYILALGRVIRADNDFLPGGQFQPRKSENVGS